MLFGKMMPAGAFTRLARLCRRIRVVGMSGLAAAAILGCVMGCGEGNGNAPVVGTYEHEVPDVTLPVTDGWEPSPDEMAMSVVEQAISGDFAAALAVGVWNDSGTETGTAPLLSVEYTVHCMSEKYISFTVTRQGRYAPNWGRTLCYNFDGVTGRTLSLRDIYGKDFEGVIWEAVGEDIMASQTRFDSPEDVRELIYEDRPFYIERECAVLLFDLGEIAEEEMGLMKFAVKLPQGAK